MTPRSSRLVLHVMTMAQAVLHLLASLVALAGALAVGGVEVAIAGGIPRGIASLILIVPVVLVFNFIQSKLSIFASGYVLDAGTRTVYWVSILGPSESSTVVARFAEVAEVRLRNPTGWRCYLALALENGSELRVSSVGGPRSGNPHPRELRDLGRSAAALLEVPFEDETATWL